MFIAIEGGEGVGKTTQMKLLRERLPVLFPERQFVFTREPGGSPFAERIRELILQTPEAKDADGKTMFGLFAAARADHLAKVILPELSSGKTVISDRFVAATYAYQVCAMLNPISQEMFLEYFRNLDARPRYTAILDMDPEAAQERVKARSGQVSNHFDESPLQFHQDLRDGYYLFAKKFSRQEHEVEIFDAGQSPEKVHEDLIAGFRKILA